MSSVNTLSVHKHNTAFSVFAYKLWFSPDSWQPSFSRMKLIFTHLVYMTSLNRGFVDAQNSVLGFVVSKHNLFVLETD